MLACAPRMPVRPGPHQIYHILAIVAVLIGRTVSLRERRKGAACDGVWGVRRLVRGRTPVPEEIWNRRGSPAPGIARRWGKWICRRIGPTPARRHQARRSWRLRAADWTGFATFAQAISRHAAPCFLLPWQLPRWDGCDGPCLASATKRSAELDFFSKCILFRTLKYSRDPTAWSSRGRMLKLAQKVVPSLMGLAALMHQSRKPRRFTCPRRGSCKTRD